MSNKDLVKKAKEWSDKIGRKQAIGRLVQGGISPITAGRICGGRYKSTPKELLARVLRAELARDGLLKSA